MTTLPLRAPAQIPFAGALARVAAALDTVFSVLEDAQAMARAAHKRYPFAEW